MESLIAKLGLDSSPFVRGLEGAKHKAKEAGAEMGKEAGKDFVKHMKRVVGIGVIIGGVIESFKDAQRIRDEGAKQGMGPQRFAALEEVTKQLGDTSGYTADEIQRLTDIVIASGNIPKDNVFSLVASAADKATAAWERFKAGALRGLEYVVRFAGSVGSGIGTWWGEVTNPNKKLNLYQAGMAARAAFKKNWNDPYDEDDEMKKKLGATAKRMNDAHELAKIENEVVDLKFKALSADQQAFLLDKQRLAAMREYKEAVRLHGAGSIEARKAELAMLSIQADPKAKDDARGRLDRAREVPLGQTGGDQLARRGLGPGLGTFSLQRQMLQEQRRQTEVMREVKEVLKTHL